MKNIDSIDFCLNISRAHASLNLKLDEELGTFHGLSFGDFGLLRMLSRAENGRMATTDLMRPLGVQLSAVTRRLILLEKVGLITREAGNSRYVAIRAAGRSLLNSALVTAGAVCDDAVRALGPSPIALINDAMVLLGCTEALDV
ncbi:AsnC family transcriptional regulator [Variovorax sp. J22R133]|uniref:MarR family winged helix-turn-helix transcriptional regulator n=1 Tax=Variovorax brevis TaxID=3053503 RepID=UPI002578E9F2|nr:AsnC family transcriptional regulator [Variovorax sp. J22R133]MDM0111354.1 AsnC family transcriptional regulator [Variovorax sp. J22R133]